MALALRVLIEWYGELLGIGWERGFIQVGKEDCTGEEKERGGVGGPPKSSV